LTWINGRAGDTIHVQDRGLHYGDGAFETMRVRRGAVRFTVQLAHQIADPQRQHELMFHGSENLLPIARNDKKVLAVGQIL